MHVLIDSCIYRQDRRRNKPGFRALLRLAKAERVRLHVPGFVKGEVLSQQRLDTRDQINSMRAAAAKILRLTNHEQLRTYAEGILDFSKTMSEEADDWLDTELQEWFTTAHATEHPIRADHGERVAAAYFAGKTPFRATKHREDLPDSFIWETALDLVNEYGDLIVVSADGRLRTAAEKHRGMTAFKSLDDFIASDACQDALTELIPVVIAENVERIKALLASVIETLQSNLDNGIIDELAWKKVKHAAIRDDNNEATIVSVGAAENVEFDFNETEHFSDADLVIPFTATVDCLLNYTLYKGDYGAIPDEEDVSISEWNDHYFDAEQNFTISAEGYLNLMIDTSLLERDDLTDDELRDIITEADNSVEVTERSVSIPGW